LKNIDKIKLPFELPNVKHIYLNYPIKLKNKDLIAKKLLKHGIDTKRKYIYACSNLKIFKEFKTKCPVSERLSRETLFLPVHEKLERKDIYFMSEALRSVLG